MIWLASEEGTKKISKQKVVDLIEQLNLKKDNKFVKQTRLLKENLDLLHLAQTSSSGYYERSKNVKGLVRSLSSLNTLFIK